MFVDASALVAVLLDEPERDRIIALCNRADLIVVSPLVVWESSVALARASVKPMAVVQDRVTAVIRRWSGRIAAIEAEDGIAALDAFARYGKGRGHPAQLNLGDCFSYAMAKRRGLPLLYKGPEFAQTDIVSALAD